MDTGQGDTVALFGTAPAPALPLLELELSQTISASPKIGSELSGALSQNELEFPLQQKPYVEVLL